MLINEKYIVLIIYMHIFLPHPTSLIAFSTLPLFLLPFEGSRIKRDYLVISPEAGNLSCDIWNLACFTCWVYKTSSQMLTGN